MCPAYDGMHIQTCFVGRLPINPDERPSPDELERRIGDLLTAAGDDEQRHRQQSQRSNAGAAGGTQDAAADRQVVDDFTAGAEAPNVLFKPRAAGSMRDFLSLITLFNQWNQLNSRVSQRRPPAGIYGSLFLRN